MVRLSGLLPAPWWRMECGWVGGDPNGLRCPLLDHGAAAHFVSFLDLLLGRSCVLSLCRLAGNGREVDNVEWV
jgi:hypothetical protein